MTELGGRNHHLSTYILLFFRLICQISCSAGFRSFSVGNDPPGIVGNEPPGVVGNDPPSAPSPTPSSSSKEQLVGHGIAYSEQNARQFLRLSECAYYSHAEAASCTEKIGWTVHFSTELVCDPLGQLCAAFVASSRRSRQIVIAFRGTHSLLQLLAEFGHSDWKKTVAFRWWTSGRIVQLGRANAYFFKALFTNWSQRTKRKLEVNESEERRQSLWNSIQDVLQTLEEQQTWEEVVFTGHSLGGAFASLAALKWALEGQDEEEEEEAQTKAVRKRALLRVIDRRGNERKVWRGQSTRVGLYTFGQPRVGCAQLARNLDALIPRRFRIVFGHDIVPHLPPCNLYNWLCTSDKADSFFHHGFEIWYEQPHNWGTFSVCHQNEDSDCSDSVLNKGAIGRRSWTWLKAKMEAMLRTAARGQQQEKAFLGLESRTASRGQQQDKGGRTSRKPPAWELFKWKMLTKGAAQLIRMVSLWKFIADHRAYFEA